MALPPAVHRFPQEIELHGGTREIVPAAIETPRGLLLVDVGAPGEMDQLTANLEAAGHAVKDIWGVVATHQDDDHVGLLHELREATDLVVFAHEIAAPYIDGRRPLQKYDERPYEPVSVDVELVEGVRFRTDAGPMAVVFTPGHSAGHISLYFPEHDLLVIADAAIATEKGLYGPYERVTVDVDEALASVAKLADLDVSGILCHHGGYVEATDADLRAVVEEFQ